MNTEIEKEIEKSKGKCSGRLLPMNFRFPKKQEPNYLLVKIIRK